MAIISKVRAHLEANKDKERATFSIAGIKALLDQVDAMNSAVPAGYLIHHPKEDEAFQREPLSENDKKHGYTETPLYDAATLEASLPTDAEPVAWVDAQELRYLQMVSGNKAWADFQRSIKVGGKKEGRSPLYDTPPAPAVAVNSDDAVTRIQNYLHQRSLSRSYDGDIHGFHTGGPREANLTVSDIEAVLAALSAQVQDVGEQIADAVLQWLVEHDLLDAGNEYQPADVISALNELVPQHALHAQQNAANS